MHSINFLNIKIESGSTVRIRPVEKSDYLFIYQLRKSIPRKDFLSKISENKNHQKQWIDEYKKRESQGLEMYFIIERLDSLEPIGTFRVYSLDENLKRVTCGSWILNERKTITAAIETILLISRMMRYIGLREIAIDTNKENKNVLRFIKKIANKFSHEDDKNVYYIIDAEKFIENFYKKHKIHIEKKDEKNKDTGSEKSK